MAHIYSIYIYISDTLARVCIAGIALLSDRCDYRHHKMISQHVRLITLQVTYRHNLYIGPNSMVL